LGVALVPLEPQSSPDRIDVTSTEIGPGVVLALTGELSLRTVPALRSTLQKFLADRGRVLVDLGGLSVSWEPALEVFPLALATASGWPAARLVLFGTPERRAAALGATRHLSAAVHVAETLEAAVGLLAVRPRRVSRRTELDCDPEAARWARIVTRGAAEDWGITADDAEADATTAVVMVASELVTNAVVHARTSTVLSLTLNDRGLRVAVRDYEPGGEVRPHPSTGGEDDRFGLVVVDGASRSWGVSRHVDGKTVWALVPCRPGDAPTDW
jgi:anti-sigma regulatory factor (Ser/Thr protein kinase)/anti-anti-sigma regulatory factor